MNVVLWVVEETTMFLVLNSESKSISVADLVCVCVCMGEGGMHGGGKGYVASPLSLQK